MRHLEHLNSDNYRAIDPKVAAREELLRNAARSERYGTAIREALEHLNYGEYEKARDVLKKAAA